MRLWMPTAFCALALTAAACDLSIFGSDAPDNSETETPDTTVSQGFVTDHVIVVSVDGLRPDAIAQFGAHTLQRMVREGSYSLEASTIMLSRTLPSHTSMLTGAELAVHGVTWNSERIATRGYVSVPTIFAVANAAGFQTAAFLGKEKLEHLTEPGTLDLVFSPQQTDTWPADSVVAHAAAHVGSTQPNLMFLHMSDVDVAGHAHGWMSEEYGRAVEEADAEIAEVLQIADSAFGTGQYTVIVTADHGGDGRDHGSADPLDVTIPWIVWGQGVRAGTVLGAGIRTMDTAATALWLLGLEPGDYNAGRVVSDAFTETLLPMP